MGIYARKYIKLSSYVWALYRRDQNELKGKSYFEFKHFEDSIELTTVKVQWSIYQWTCHQHSFTPTALGRTTLINRFRICQGQKVLWTVTSLWIRQTYLGLAINLIEIAIWLRRTSCLIPNVPCSVYLSEKRCGSSSAAKVRGMKTLIAFLLCAGALCASGEGNLRKTAKDQNLEERSSHLCITDGVLSSLFLTKSTIDQIYWRYYLPWVHLDESLVSF